MFQQWDTLSTGSLLGNTEETSSKPPKGSVGDAKDGRALPTPALASATSAPPTHPGQTRPPRPADADVAWEKGDPRGDTSGRGRALAQGAQEACWRWPRGWCFQTTVK